jgi:hypothetical protein
MANTNYSGSKCPQCKATSFEIAEETPTHSAWKLYFVRCSFCKTAIGVIEYYNSGSLLHKIMDKLGIGKGPF